MSLALSRSLTDIRDQVNSRYALASLRSRDLRFILITLIFMEKFWLKDTLYELMLYMTWYIMTTTTRAKPFIPIFLGRQVFWVLSIKICCAVYFYPSNFFQVYIYWALSSTSINAHTHRTEVLAKSFCKCSAK